VAEALGPHLKLPARLDRVRCTQKQARAPLAESAACYPEILAEALTGPHGRVRNFRRDGWARPWPVCAAMFAYMVSHDAHHRGQVQVISDGAGSSKDDHFSLEPGG
jgi:hypothetical protein